MYEPIRKKLFKHGGSRAIDLPADFVHRLGRDTVNIELRQDGLFIPLDDSLDNLEQDPLFENFIEAICQDALRNPDKLKEIHEVWDDEWDSLLEGVDDREED